MKLIAQTMCAGLAAALLAGCTTTAPSEDATLSRMLDRQLAGESQTDGDELANRIAEAEKYPLGSDRNPVRAQMPPGQRAYLARLRCPSGAAPEFDRIGSFGIGIYGNIVDGYRVECPDGKTHTVVMDMYHRGYVESRAVPGFTIVSE